MSRHGMGLGLGTIPALRTRNTKTGQADGSEGRVWRDPNLSPPQKKKYIYGANSSWHLSFDWGYLA